MPFLTLWFVVDMPGQPNGEGCVGAWHELCGSQTLTRGSQTLTEGP